MFSLLFESRLLGNDRHVYFSCWSLASTIYDKYWKPIDWRFKKLALALHAYFRFSSVIVMLFVNWKNYTHIKKKKFKVKILFFVYNVNFCCYISRILQWIQYQWSLSCIKDATNKILRCLLCIMFSLVAY